MLAGRLTEDHGVTVALLEAGGPDDKSEIHIPAANSLKAKRQVVKSIVGQVRSHFDVAVAEVGDQDLWQLAEVGVACVTSDVRHGHEVMSKVASFPTSPPEARRSWTRPASKSSSAVGSWFGP